MKIIIFSLIVFEIGYVQKLVDECVVDIFIDLLNEQIQVGVNDIIGFIFEFNNKCFMFFNIGFGFLVVRIC